MSDALPAECFPPLMSRGERAGLICTVVARLTSLVVVLAVVCRILYRAADNFLHPSWHCRRIFTSHMDVYMTSLLLAHTVQASTGTYSILWLRRGSATCGHPCNAQGLIETIGDPAAALTTLAIALHIIITVMCRRRFTSFWIPISVVCAIWTYFLVHAGISMSLHHSQTRPLFTPTPYWCWISAWYPRERLTAAYMWYWMTAACTSVIYIVLFFYIRSVDVASKRFWTWGREQKRSHPVERTGRNLLSTQSKKMLIYPAVYVAVILPQSLIRWMTSGGVTVAPFWVFLAQCIFSLGGVCDALLLIFTRPRVLGFAPSQHTDDDKDDGSPGIVANVGVSTNCDWNHGLESMPHSATALTLDAQSPGYNDSEATGSLKA
ncbi:hypothetical protein EXIGLDRAFT_73175 [Exidia glandulosa HHB12029]|uniref:Uncharacterized protein n=1 Tax=Exidia glandulosa HHB12029 TaxID=1314781 RepID=A0A165HUY3_EXIGL|nr:hypothetical protein EXIGLDRAFT_73175 [Exidia glandulosa HHB12029]